MATPAAAPHTTTRKRWATLVVLMSRVALADRAAISRSACPERFDLVFDIDLARFREDQGPFHHLAHLGWRLEVEKHGVGGARLEDDGFARIEHQTWLELAHLHPPSDGLHLVHLESAGADEGAAKQGVGFAAHVGDRHVPAR